MPINDAEANEGTISCMDLVGSCGYGVRYSDGGRAVSAYWLYYSLLGFLGNVP